MLALRMLLPAAGLLLSASAHGETTLREIKDPMTDAVETLLVVLEDEGRAALSFACSDDGGSALVFRTHRPLSRSGFKAEIRFDQAPMETIAFQRDRSLTEARMVGSVRVDIAAKTDGLEKARAAARAEIVRWAERIAAAERILFRAPDMFGEDHLYVFHPGDAKDKVPEFREACAR